MALNPLDPVLRDIAEIKRQLAGRSQLNHSSLENTAIPVYDANDVERMRIGAQDDGTHAIKYVQGPPPPRPTAPVVSVDGPVVRVRWDGMLMGGHIPEDFARIDVHFALASDDLESPEAVGPPLTTVTGSEATLLARETGTYRVGLVAMSQSRARSEMSDTVEVEVTLVDLEGALDAVIENARGGSNYYTPQPPAGTDHDPDRDLWFDTSEGDDGLVHYTPHRWDGQQWVSLEDERVQAVQDAQREFEQSTSEALTGVQQAAAGAQSAADAAQETADTARSEATSKAAAAQQAAEAHAEAVAEAERLAAIAAASDDASAKAAAAEAAATAAAALDAKAKADAAQAAAEAKAQAAQDAAAAAMDRANAAHSAAGSAADAAEAAMQAATHNAKNMWSTENPSGTAPRGTIWFKIDPVTKNVVGQWQQTAGSDSAFGSNWEKRSLTDALFDNIDAGKIGTGYLDVAKLIRAGAIQADKILVGGAGNLLTNPGFTGDGAGWNLSSYNPQIATSGGPTGEPVLSIQHSDPNSALFPYLGGLVQSVAGSFAPDLAAVEAGKRYSASVWVRADVDIPVGNAGMGFRLRELGSATLGWANPSTATNREVIPANTWAKIEGDFLVPTNTGTWNRLAFGLRANGALNGRRVEFSAPVLLPMIGGTLIEPGSVNTPHLAAGAITAESGIIGSLDLGVAIVGKLHGTYIEGQTVGTEQLAFGAATGDVLAVDALNFKTGIGMDFRSSSFRAGDAVEITEDFGIRQFGPDGALNVSLPSDGSPAEFRGDLSARTLTATGRMSVQGPGAIASGGVLELESGVVPPVAGPQIVNEWERIALPPLAENERATGIAWAAGHWWRAVDVSGVSEGDRIEKITPTGDLVSSFPIVFFPTNGMTAIGDELFLLGIGDTPGVDRYTSRRYVRVYGIDGTFKRQWEYTEYGTGTYQPGIGKTGQQLIIAQCWASGELTYRTYNSTDGKLLREHHTEDMFRQDVAGILYGTFDIATDANRAVVGKRVNSGTNPQFTVLNSLTKEYEPQHSWHAVGLQSPVGIAWDGTHFYSMGSDGNLHKYQPLEVGRFVGDDETDWWGAVMWRTGSQETTVGPATRFRYLHRSRLRRSNGDVPEGVEEALFCMAKTSTEPARTDLRVLTVSSTPGLSTWIGNIPANWQTYRTPPATNTFTADAPGEIHSAIGNFRVDGTGAGEWGPLAFHADGTMTGLIASGQVVVTPTGANTITSVVVTLPAGRFTESPEISLTSYSGSPNQTSATVWPITKESFTVNVHSTTTSARRVGWQAIDGKG